MGKVRRLIAACRRREFLFGAGTTFVAAVGLGSGMLGVVDKHFAIPTAFLIFAGAFLVSAVMNYRLLANPQVAVDDLITSDTYDDPFTHVRCPCSYTLASDAKKLAADCFSGSISIEPDTFEAFRVKNPLILACLTSRSGKFLGYFDAIPLTDSFADALLKGTVTEEQLTHEEVLSEKQMAGCRYLFVSGFAVVEPRSFAGKRNASILTWALLQYLKKHYLTATPLVFALAATRSGDEILQRFKLPLANSGQGRRDRYRLYSIRLSFDELERRLTCVPDWRMICSLDWMPDKIQKKGRRPSPPKAAARDLA